ncbi:MAG: type II 3-dehydroquinate dehydratase [Gammaproteobacteria bacterium]|nr:MAG: type II 3-dehydroquinate dehydratase [Gammaproteobacteria bacterium]
MKKRVLLLDGPNLNLLGQREPETYGDVTLQAIREQVAKELSPNIELHCYQSNHEGALVERIHQAASEHIDFIMLNPAGLTHTSVVMRDALLAVRIPFIELHLSNPHAREPFRHHSYFSDIALGVICGFKEDSYILAAKFIKKYLTS